MNTGIYQIKNINDGKIYIGSAAGKGFKHRWKFHIDTLIKNIHHNIHLQRAWNKYGKDNFIFSIIEECKPEECLIKEQFYINKLNPEYNIYKIAGSPMGRVVSQTTKEKISNSLKGRVLSIETKNKISKSLFGKPKSYEHRNKVCESLSKTHWNKGRYHGRFSGNYIFLNLKTGIKVICGKFELSDTYNLDRSGVCKLCNGKQKLIKKEWICLGKE